MPIGWLYGTYHLLREPGNSIDITNPNRSTIFLGQGTGRQLAHWYSPARHQCAISLRQPMCLFEFSCPRSVDSEENIWQTYKRVDMKKNCVSFLYLNIWMSFFLCLNWCRIFGTINSVVMSPWNLDWLDTVYMFRNEGWSEICIYPKTPDPSYGNTRPSVNDTPKRALKQVVLTPHDIPWSLRVYKNIYIYIYTYINMCVCVHISGLQEVKPPVWSERTRILMVEGHIW